LARTYHQLYQRMQDKLNALLVAIAKLDAPTQGQIYKLAQYKNLVAALEIELAKYGVYVEMEIKANSQAAIELALKHTETFLKSAGYMMPKHLPVTAIYNMLSFLQEGSPLFERISQLAPFHAGKVADALTEAVAFGYNPAKTARMMAKYFENAMGQALTDAMRMSRTAQMYAAREASRASYIANSDVVLGWMWKTSLDGDVCMACAVEHGTVHDLDESMNGHYNCRCYSVPIVKGYEYNDQKGVDWFTGLDEKQQESMMGKTAFEAWKTGAFDLADMATRRHDDVYGEMLARTPLKDLITQ